MSSRYVGWSGALLCVVFIATLLSGNVFGQAQDGNLVGSIFDSSGAAVPNAKVELENTATGVKSAATTDAAGFYRFNNLLVGRYRITASAAGLASRLERLRSSLTRRQPRMSRSTLAG